jgi:hypothetical protein
METLNLSTPAPDFKLPKDATTDGGFAQAGEARTAKRTRSKGNDAGAKDEPLDGEDLLDLVATRTYEIMCEDLESGIDAG